MYPAWVELQQRTKLLTALTNDHRFCNLSFGNNSPEIKAPQGQGIRGHIAAAWPTRAIETTTTTLSREDQDMV